MIVKPRFHEGPDEFTSECNCTAGCGDGFRDDSLGEACDDGNDLDGDGCSA